MAAIVLPKDYGYVLLTATSSFLLAMWHGNRVGQFRSRAKIPYPHAYATQEAISTESSPERKQAMHLFNCAQRAHYNFLENYVIALPALMVGGLAYPKTAAVMGAAWCVARVLYAVGYTNPAKEAGKGRYNGILFWLAQLGLIGVVGKMGVDVLMA